MATIYFSIRKTKKTAKNTYVVYLTVCHKREVRYIATEYEVEDLYQFDKGRIVCRKDAKIMNQRLTFVLSEYNKRLISIKDQDIYNCSQIKETLEGKQKIEQNISLVDHVRARICKLRKEGRNSYADMNACTLEKIKSILGEITLQSLSTITIDKFTKGMSGSSNATKQMRLAHLKACINEAICEGLIKYDIHPFAYT